MKDFEINPFVIGISILLTFALFQLVFSQKIFIGEDSEIIKPAVKSVVNINEDNAIFNNYLNKIATNTDQNHMNIYTNMFDVKKTRFIIDLEKDNIVMVMTTKYDSKDVKEYEYKNEIYNLKKTVFNNVYSTTTLLSAFNKEYLYLIANSEKYSLSNWFQKLSVELDQKKFFLHYILNSDYLQQMARNLINNKTVSLSFDIKYSSPIAENYQTKFQTFINESTARYGIDSQKGDRKFVAIVDFTDFFKQNTKANTLLSNNWKSYRANVNLIVNDSGQDILVKFVSIGAANLSDEKAKIECLRKLAENLVDEFVKSIVR